jgi:hypothetical protein
MQMKIKAMAMQLSGNLIVFPFDSIPFVQFNFKIQKLIVANT